MDEHQVPVVLEFILERVTNIAMGTEIDSVNEFEEILVSIHRCRSARRQDMRTVEAPRQAGRRFRREALNIADFEFTAGRPASEKEDHAEICRQPDHAVHRTAVPRAASPRPRTRASTPSSSCSRIEFDKRRARRACSQHNGLTLVLHNLPAGDWAAGERGIACHARSRRRSFATASTGRSTTPRRSSVPQVNCLAGIPPNGVDRRRGARDPRRQSAASPRAN